MISTEEYMTLPWIRSIFKMLQITGNREPEMNHKQHSSFFRVLKCVYNE